MNKVKIMKPIRLIAASVLAAGLWPAAAQAQVSRTFVSVNGNDANDCLQPSTACRTLNGGIAKVDAQGEVIVIDTGSFAGASITKAVKINAPTGVIAFSASPVVINAPGATVVIKGLTLKAIVAGSGGGIVIQAAGTVMIEGCVLDSWGQAAVRVESAAGAVRVDVKDTTFRNNFDGLDAFGTGALITVDQSRFENHTQAGVVMFGPSKIIVTRSQFAGGQYGVVSNINGSEINAFRSTFTGASIYAIVGFPASSVIRVAESIVSGNNVGFATNSVIESFKDNILLGNTTDVIGVAPVAVTRQ